MHMDFKLSEVHSMLVKFYDENKPTSDEFEIILISSDDDDKAMEGYAKDKGMNWPQLKLSKVKRF